MGGDEEKDMTFNFSKTQTRIRVATVFLTEAQYMLLVEVAKEKKLNVPEIIDVFLEAAIQEYKTI